MTTPRIPHVLNKYRDVIPPDAVNIMRPSKWGNPFKIGVVLNGKKMTRDDVIKAHRHWLLFTHDGQMLLRHISELKGKDLICCCKPAHCHGDTLLEIANELGIGTGEYL